MDVPEPDPVPRAPKRTRPGIKDVAAMAGVSWKTVSNVINGTAAVRPATRARVEAAIEELGYRPTLSGRHLRQGRSNLLALAIADLRLSYFSDLAHAVIEAAGKKGYTVLLDETFAEEDRERHAAHGFGVHLLDGLIFSPQTLPRDEVLRAGQQLPTVLLGEHALPGPDEHVPVDRVLIDNIASAREATEHLLATGRRKLVFLGADMDEQDSAGALRRDGYLQALGSDATPVVLPTTIFSRTEGLEHTAAFLAEAGPGALDGLICANDQLAIGAMLALRRAGLRVPEDVGVLGWDGSEEGYFANPGLTTITPDLDDLATLAVNLLLARIDGTGGPPAVHPLPYTMHIRESTQAT
ncbi:MAG TPA: LacI family DNA-binding transcriptional regulator [Beutenbergiaceae bacterium]|nr:LacI family DNA-binding transcriptional regulator [Beutenbergiaceae bacterium]